MNKYYYLVVLYKKKPFESETINSILENKESLDESAELVIWDNSPYLLSDEEKQGVQSFFPKMKVTFWGDGNNWYLSKIYNKIISYVDHNAILVLLDHDSNLDKDYFIRLKTAVENNTNINLFLPIVLSRNLIVSPAYEFLFRNKMLASPIYGVQKTNHMMAINSAMAIRTNYLKNNYPGYDEHLKFYGTDNDFMLKYSQQNELLYVLESSIHHSLNFVEDNLESKISRFKSMIEGKLFLSRRKGFFAYIVEIIRTIYLSFKYGCKFHSLRFFKALFIC